MFTCFWQFVGSFVFFFILLTRISIFTWIRFICGLFVIFIFRFSSFIIVGSFVIFFYRRSWRICITIICCIIFWGVGRIFRIGIFSNCYDNIIIKSIWRNTIQLVVTSFSRSPWAIVYYRNWTCISRMTFLVDSKVSKFFCSAIWETNRIC